MNVYLFLFWWVIFLFPLIILWVYLKINKFFFTSERGVYVRLEYRGNWHDFRVDFINKYLKPQFKISPSSFNITESEDEFNVVAPNEWNIETLTVGDTITPDMWDQSKLGRRKDYFEKPIKIDWIGYNEFDDEELELKNELITYYGHVPVTYYFMCQEM